MPVFKQDIVIDAPPETVFAFLAQPERLPEWTPGVLRVRRTSPGPIGVGSTTEALVEAFGVGQVLLVGCCTAFEAPRRLAVQNETTQPINLGPVVVRKVTSTSSSVLVPEGAGTRLVASLEYTISAGMLTGLAEGIAGPQMRGDFNRSLENLKRLLERPSSS
jgi:ligand-binding SRPBCC domain-containing protein